jgi:hypothetical protein
LEDESKTITVESNWLCRIKLRMVGAIGFEPMTSTV